ncbi:pyrimidine operon attenuation protein / uracil phosphoribosyltransferase [Spirosomataceae bacterium TFI 002]|nr:pyrimidine operon attenuation protein / uracil phosphoribosyltransferase [Spirosomataceae bacterium TFI 002]
MPIDSQVEEVKEFSVLLDATTTLQKVKRMGYEILENNFDQKEIVLVGIDGEGFRLAELLLETLTQVTDKKVEIARVIFDKKAKTQPDIKIESEIDTFKNKTIIMIDDVLNTGRTIAFALRPFLSIPLKKIEVAVLVDRDHLIFPVSAKYIGYSLSTTLREHIKVKLSDKNDVGVYLY